MRSLLFILLYLCTGLPNAESQPVKTIQLTHEVSNFAPASFRIAAVVDDRKDTTRIGALSLSGGAGKTKINLRGGAAWSLMNFINSNIHQQPTANLITLHIINLDVTDRNSGSQNEVSITMDVAFYFGDKKLVTYNGSGYTEAGIDPVTDADKLIGEKLESALKNFNQFWIESKAVYTGKAPVTVNIEFSKESDAPDHIVYSRQRPLAIDDFKGPVDEPSIAVAATVSGISLGYSSETNNDKVTLKINVAVYFDKSSSWCKPNARNKRTLAHEQIHFDITAIMACALISKIKNHSFSSDNYAKEMEQLRKQNLKDAELIEADYDKETVHGTIDAQQKKWSDKIKQQLAEQSCF